MNKNGCNPEEKQGASCPVGKQIALLGNPNAGKTSLFNLLTGTRQRTGNWPGVTVERKSGQCRLQNEVLEVIDLPGTYSLDFTDTSADEQVTRSFVLANPELLYLNIVDASTLERGLYLTLQLRELGLSMVVILNMMDVATQRGMQINIPYLQAQLGCPVVPVSLRDEHALKILQAALGGSFAPTGSVAIPYHTDIEHSLQQLQTAHDWTRTQALLALQTDTHQPQIHSARARIEAAHADEDFDFLLADARFDYATKMASQSIHERGKISRTHSDKLDRWVLGSWTGVPVFLLMMYLLFFFSINLGGALIDFFDLSAQTLFVDGSRYLLANWGLPEWLITFVADGLGGGLLVVATFVPVIGALYLFLTLLEESGYMSRAAFVMDQFLRKLGISGKAFVPLIVGFGCNVPSIMATRTLDTRRERIIAVMMAPFMSCGARLAVYALFAAAFFKTAGHNIVFLLYLTGIAFAIMTALILRKTLLQGAAGHFVMEMPTYQRPQLRNVLTNTWNKLKGFVLGAGKIIVIMVATINILNSLGTDGSFGHQDTEHSLLSAGAKAITPVFAPMGISDDNWPATVGILSGLLAKEVVVGTLDALYGSLDQSTVQPPKTPIPYSLWGGLQTAAATIPVNLQQAASTLTDPLGFGILEQEQVVEKTTFVAMQSRFDGAIGAFAYLLFILMYFPCVAATGAMYREIGARWTALGVAWSTGMGYGAAVLFYQLASFNRHPGQSLFWVLLICTLFLTTLYTFQRAGRNSKPQHYQLKVG